ncbi:hypothetical protein ACQY0O_006824 [Thecaphora frezii]
MRIGVPNAQATPRTVAQHAKHDHKHGKVYTVSDVKCFTELGNKRVKQIKTRTVTDIQHSKAKVTKTVRPKVTATAAVPTQTITEHPTSTVTVTNQAVTDVFSTTSTVTETQTLSPTVATTETATSTVTATNSVTVTVPPGPVFTPILQSIPIGDGDLSLTKRGHRELVNLDTFGLSKHGHGHGRHGKEWCHAQKYPQSVKCKKRINLVTVTTYTHTAKPRTVTRTPAASTATVTSTTTSTSTVVPAGVTQTVSFTATETATTTLPTVTATETQTATSTLNVDLPVATSYSACDKNNMLDRINGQSISGLQFNSQEVNTSSAASKGAVDCCTTCQQDPICAYSLSFNEWCLLFKYKNGNTCSASMTQGFTTGVGVRTSGSAVQMTISNGACSQAINQW